MSAANELHANPITSSSMKIGDLRPFGTADFTKRSVNLTCMALPLLRNDRPSEQWSCGERKMLDPIWHSRWKQAEAPIGYVPDRYPEYFAVDWGKSAGDQRE
jgi:hypothetical protein